MFKKITFLFLLSVISISFVFSSGLWLEKKDKNYNTGEIIPTPVPVETVKRTVLDNGYIAPTTGEPCQDMWGIYNDCDLYPVYDENNIPIEYLVLAYRERSERLGMFDMLDKVKPYIYEYMKLVNEKAKLEIEDADYYYKSISSEIEEEIKEVCKKINGNLQYGFGFVKGIYELPPQMSEFHNGCIPGLFIFYYKAIDEVKEKYNTDDVEFICFRTLGGLGSRGWEFRAGDKRLYVTTYLEEKLGEPRWHILIKEITPDLKSLWIERYNESYKELWKKYENKSDEQGMLNRNNDSMGVYILPYVADFSRYEDRLPEGSCAHVAASNILAYQNYKGYEQIPYYSFNFYYCILLKRII